MGTQAASAGQYTQSERPIAVSTTLGGDNLLLVGFDGDEAVSQPFHYTLDMLSRDAAIAGADLLRSKVTVTLALPDGDVRYVNGRVSRFVQLDNDGEFTAYRAEIVPACWFLSLFRDCRVFAEKSIPDIVETVLGEGGLSAGRDYELKLYKSYAARPYVMQYRETNLDFVSRLLEEVGIFYYFEHSDGGHTMVLTDANSATSYPAGTQPVRMTPTGGATARGDAIDTLVREDVAHSGKVAVADYNFRTPSVHLLSSVPGKHPEEVYDYPGRFRDRGAGDALANVRLEELEAAGVLVRGDGACRSICAGGRFDVKHHYRREFNRGYLALRVHLSARISGFRSGEDVGFQYHTSFVAIPFDVPFRPPRITPVPRIPGAQTAVVGPGREEIYSDEHARVPIQFHWDRRNKQDGKPSCWARVSSGWAGKAWGAISLPRVGQEVVIEFLEGDPDRPMVTGRVYNGEQKPPYDLPAHQTRSTMKSRSSPNGGPDNFNEIRFEDKKGAEEVYIHAERDQKVTVERNNTVGIGADESYSVGHDQSFSVGNDRSKSIEKNETVSVGGDRSETVGKDESVGVGSNRSVSVGKNDSLDVSANNEIAIGKNQTISVGENRDISVGKDQSQSVGKKYVLNAGDEIVIKTGSASITMKKDGTIKIKGKDVTIEGSGKINVKASSDVTIKGSKVAAN